MRVTAAVLLGLILQPALAGPVPSAQPRPQPLVMLVSIDGLKPEAILDADAHGLKVPNLMALMPPAYAACCRR